MSARKCRYLADDIFKCILFHKSYGIFYCNLTETYVSSGSIDNKLELVLRPIYALQNLVLIGLDYGFSSKQATQ